MYKIKKNHLQPTGNLLPVLGLILVVLFSCTLKSGEQNTSGNEPLPAEPNRVEVMALERGDFYREIVSNGKLAAIEKAGLYFQNSGTIEAVNVRNGQTVQTSVELARLQNDEFRFNMKKAEVALEKATIDRLDALLSMGYKSLEAEIPADHLKIANIRSGYNQAKIQHEEAVYQLENAILKAPFAGKVEGVTQKAWEKTDLSKPFCTLINDNRFTISFPLLETEVHEVTAGQKITVTPIAGLSPATGVVTEMNPRIDENGLAWVKAEVNNPGGYMEGMNVKVSIKKAIPNRLVVPKQAVVLRQNREVLFRYTHGTAYWTYVEVLDENESQYAVVAAEGATLEQGDTVIISNNLNLAHESEVEME
jgi:membrane fusion protein, multidrug efflux system